jgi:hypothetical protein
MKTKLIFFLLALSFSIALQAQHEDHPKAVVADSVKKSIPKEVHVQLGDNSEVHMMIHYHAPAVRGRVIWGGLVPFGDVWVTGAHSATTWEFNQDIVIIDKVIPQGKYAIFTIPGKDSWIFILNKKWNQHLADEYDAKDDVLRFNVIPKSAEKNQERLKYAIVEEANSAMSLSISWEKLRVAIPFKMK